MSAQRLWVITITCDICGVHVQQSALSEKGHDEEGYLKRLAEYGWLRNPAGLDICPRCAPRFEFSQWNKGGKP